MMKTISQILTLLVVLKVAMSSTVEMVEVTTNIPLLNLGTSEVTEEVTSKPSDLQTDAVISFITTKTSLASVEHEEVLTKPTESFTENVITKISTIKLESQELVKTVQKETLDIEDITKSSSSNFAKEKQTEEIPITNLILDDFGNKKIDSQSNLIIYSKLSEAQTESSGEEIVPNNTTNQTQTLVAEIIRNSATTLEDYLVKEMLFILDHILIASQEFVTQVLQATGNSTFQRDYLKRFAENLDILLNPEDDDYSDDTDMSLRNQKPPEDPYSNVLKKLAFLKGKFTKQLQERLPADWIGAYKNNKQDITIWLDKAFEQMRAEVNQYISNETDHVKYQYFNEAFDDIPRATETNQKLAIILDLIKIAKNKKQITFLDLYMQ